MFPFANRSDVTVAVGEQVCPPAPGLVNGSNHAASDLRVDVPSQSCRERASIKVTTVLILLEHKSVSPTKSAPALRFFSLVARWQND